MMLRLGSAPKGTPGKAQDSPLSHESGLFKEAGFSRQATELEVQS
jgi:hypothetical protein